MNYGPLTVGVSANNTNFMYLGSSGLINSCPITASVDHAVLLVGYNTTHWFIKNSWGTNWGSGGYGFILRSNDCQLKKEVNVMMVNAATPITYDTVAYTIYMTDSRSNGWNGTLLAFKQGTTIAATFGSNFKTGATSNQTVTIKNNL